LLLALGFLLGSRLRTVGQRVAVVIWLLVVVATVMMVVANSSQFFDLFPWFPAFYNPLIRFWEFATGACVAVAAPKLMKIRTSVSWLLALAGTFLFTFI